MVVNTDPSGCAGTHWCALYVNSPTHVEYYDSFGDWPPCSPSIADYLVQFDRIHKSESALQSDESSACGKHCIYFLVKRCRGMSFDSIVSELKNFKQKPDMVVSSFVRNQLVEKCDFINGT
jgi:hypothetical protein